MTVIEVQRRQMERTDKGVRISALLPWRRWHGYPPADADTNECRCLLLREVWPLWQFRVVMELEP